MAILNSTWTTLSLFVRTDIYYFTTDNKIVFPLLGNDLAMNAQIEELLAEYRERALWNIENPVVENGAGGVWISETGGTITWIVVSCSQPGSSGNFVLDITCNGTSIFGPSSNQPVLAYNSSLPYVIVSGANIPNGTIPPLGVLQVNVSVKQAGSPRYLQVLAPIIPNIPEIGATSFAATLAAIAASVPP